MLIPLSLVIYVNLLSIWTSLDWYFRHTYFGVKIHKTGKFWIFMYYADFCHRDLFLQYHYHSWQFKGRFGLWTQLGLGIQTLACQYILSVWWILLNWKYDTGINFVEKTAEACVIRLMVVIGRGEKCNIYHLSFARSWIQWYMVLQSDLKAQKFSIYSISQYL